MSAESENERAKRKSRKKLIYQKIIQQMEFYFSPANLSKDRWLSNKLQEEESIDLTDFLRFNKIKALTEDVKDLVKALRMSEVLTVTEEMKVKCSKPIKFKENEDDYVIYVEQVPPDADHDLLKGIFSRYGDIDYISIPRFKNSNKCKGFAFIEFAKIESAQNAVQDFKEKGNYLSTEIAPEELLSIANYEGDSAKKIRNDEEPSSSVMESENQYSDEAIAPKKRRGSEMEDENQSAEISSSSKKRKNTQEESDDQEGPSTQRKKRYLETEDENQMTTTNQRKKKRSRTDEDNQEAEEVTSPRKRKISETDGDDPVTSTMQEQEKKKKKDEMCEESGAETQDNMDASEDNLESEDGNTKRKKNRKKKNKKKKNKETNESSSFQILTKKDWKRLRNKYLNMQKEKMKQLKKHLYMAQKKTDPSRQNPRTQNKHKFENNEQNRSEMKDKKEIQEKDFHPGLIVKMDYDEPIVDVKNLKSEMKKNPSVQFVDVKEGVHEVFLRFDSAEAATKFCEESTGVKTKVLKGQKEAEYWEKLQKQRAEKRSAKVNKKDRGKEKLMKKAEHILGKHIIFDEI